MKNTAKKLDYTKKELKKLGWSTIGGRIEDFSRIGWFQGKEAVYNEIEKQYGSELVDEVFRGFIVYTEFGTSAYYTPKYL